MLNLIVRHKNEQGAITLYLLLILVAMFFFMGLLIDITRVLAAKKAVLKAANASAMSVLADYNPDLRSYGLYGLRDASSANVQFNKYLTENLATNGLLDYKVESATNYGDSLTASSLLDQAVLKQEILQEMKYRAPIELTTQLIDAFSSMGKMAGKYDKANKIENNGKQKSRNDKMNLAKQNLKHKFPENSQAESDLTKKSNVFKNSWSTLQSMKDEDLVKADSDLSALLKSINGADGVKAYTTSIDKYVEDHVQTLLTDDDNNLKNELESSTDPMYPDSSPTKNDEKIDPEYDEKSAYLETDTLTKSVEAIKKYRDQLNLIQKEADSLKTAIDSKDIQEIRKQGIALSTDLQSLKSLEDNLANLQVAPHPSVPKVTYPSGNNGKYNGNKDQNMLNLLNGQFQLHNDLKSAEGYFIKENKLIKAKDIVEPDHNGVWTFINNLFTKLSNIGYSSRDALFINEFALSKFSCFAQENPTTPSSDPFKNHVLKSSEIEYVLYGNGSPLADISAALAELFAVRTAINTLYYFTFQPNPDPTMLTRLVSSVAAGAILAVADVADLTINKSKVRLMGQWGPFGSYGPLLDYNDYLRLFMLLQSNNDEVKLARIQSIISLNSEDSHFDLTPPTLLKNASTVASFDAKVSIRLWFIPRIAKAVSKFGGFEVQGDRAILSQQVTASY